MGRPKGSKNRVKTSNKSDAPAQAAQASPDAPPDSHEAEQGPPDCGGDPAAPSDGAAAGDAGPAVAEAAVAARDYNAEPLTDEEIADLADTLCSVIKQRKAKDDERKATAAAYKEQIETLDAKIADLADQHVRALEKEDLDFDAGIATVTHRRTGAVIRTRPLLAAERQTDLPFDHPSKPPQANKTAPGTRLWLDDKGMVDDVPTIVTVESGPVDGHCLCTLPNGEQGQIEVERLEAGEIMMPERKRGGR